MSSQNLIIYLHDNFQISLIVQGVDNTGNQVSRIALHNSHRRRINKEKKAKVVAAVWGTEFCSIPYRASCFALARF